MSDSPPIEYSIAVADWELWIREIRGTEALSQPFHFEAKFFLDHQSMPLAVKFADC